MKKALIVVGCIVFNIVTLFAQKHGNGSIKGVIIEKATSKPLEFASIVLKNKMDTLKVQGTITDKNGQFQFENLPLGTYILSYSFIGFETLEIPAIVLDAKQEKADVGKLYLSETSKTLKEVEVIGQKSTYVSSIDRKTFNVGQDLMSKTGSVSDLLQSVPSVQVDIDGNVALRGSENVTILINGKPSALMGTNRAAVLQQMPAGSIEKIEVITNPSAKYKPDGTSGIINIVLKKNKSLGFNGSISAHAGNDERYNGNVIVNYNPGKINVFGSYSVRQDDRLRFNNDYRKSTRLNEDTTNYQLYARDYSRPLSHIVNTGIDYKINETNKMGISGNYNYRSFVRNSTDVNTYRESDFSVSKNYDRLRRDPEFEKDLEFSAYLQHSFAREGHELNTDFTTSRSNEVEDNHYTNKYHIPAESVSYDNTRIKQADNESQFTLEYVNPISEDITLESGYILESRVNDMDFYGEYPDANNELVWVKDTEKTNRFVYTENIHVLYSTYEQDFGKFGFLAGLRAEQAFVNSDQKTVDTVTKNQYFRLYPSLHLSYKFTEVHELQLNYSHRINRPEGDDMNPFPEYQDPYNLRVGNPYLKPADIHSIELGYQYQKEKTSFISTMYYRYTYNGMSDIVTFMDSIQRTTKVNISKNTSAGLELIFATSLGNVANFNLSTNVFYNTIDVSNLGFSKNKSVVAWSANLSGGINFTKSTVMQITSNYSAERLTPQGRQLPTYVLNLGLKQEVFKRKGAFTFTVSDVFNTLKYNTIVETPELYRKLVRKRSARIIYAGFTYSFGSTKKKEKENAIKFDNQI